MDDNTEMGEGSQAPVEAHMCDDDFVITEPVSDEDLDSYALFAGVPEDEVEATAAAWQELFPSG